VAPRHPGSRLERFYGPENVVPTSSYWSRPGHGGSAYYTLSGASLSAGMVSGAAALLLQADPTLTPDDVKARLMKTARKVWRADQTAESVFSRGAGYVDVVAALQCRDRVVSPACSPLCEVTAGGLQLRSSAGLGQAQSVWGNQALRGDQALWGDVSRVAIEGDR